MNLRSTSNTFSWSVQEFKMLPFIVWFIVCTSGNDAGVKPGLKMRLSQPGLNYGAAVAVDILATKVRQLTIPDQRGSARVAVGRVDYEVTNMKVTRFQPPTTTVTVNSGSGLTWKLTDANMAVHGDWRIKYRVGFIKIRDHGNFDIDTSGVSVTVSVALGLDTTGHPTISTTACACQVQRVKIKVHGGASWLYKLFLDKIEKSIRKDLERLVCVSARKAIDVNAREELATLKEQVVIKRDWLLDYRMVSPPVFAVNYVDLFHKGEFFFKTDPSEAPFDASPMPSSGSTDRMLTIWASDYVVNTAGYALFKHGVLAYNVSKSDLPEKDKDYLNTTCMKICFGKIVPQVGNKFPNASVEIYLAASERPQLQISPTGIAGHLLGDIVYKAKLENGSLAYMFSTKIQLKLAVTVNMTENVIKAKVDHLVPNITITDTAIGEISPVVLQLAFDVIANFFLIPRLNDVGAKGVPLPSIRDVQFVNSKLVLENRTLSILSDVKYTRGDNRLYFN